MNVLRKRREIVVQLLAFALSPFAARLAHAEEKSGVDVKTRRPTGNTSTSISAADQKKNLDPIEHRKHLERVALDFMDRAFNQRKLEAAEKAKECAQAQRVFQVIVAVVAVVVAVVVATFTFGNTLGGFVALFVAMMPDIKVVARVVGVRGNQVSLAWVADGTHTGEVDGIPPTKRRIHLTGVAVLTVEDGKVTAIKGRIDEEQLRTQFGGKKTGKDLKAKVRKPACEPPLCGETVQSPPAGRAVAKPPTPAGGRPSVLGSGLLDDKPGFSSQGPAGMGAPKPSAPSAPIGIR
jgi:hypothetical protein